MIQKNMRQLVYILLFPMYIHTAASDQESSSLSSSPNGAWLTDYAYSIGTDLLGWGAKKLGMQPVDYCIDKKAEHLLKDAELTLELAFADNRKAGRTKTYTQLLSNPAFCRYVERLNDHSYFEWMHVLAEIQEDHHKTIRKFEKLNRINLPPTLRFAIQLYLKQAKQRKEDAFDPKGTVVRFDLSRIEYAPGYVEAATPIISIPFIEGGTEPERDAELARQNEIIRQCGESLVISSPIQRAERGLRKHIDSSFSDEYLDTPGEIRKSQHIYAVLIAYLRRQFILNRPFPDLFRDQKFIQVYKQAWDRDTHLRNRLYIRLKEDSLKVCDMYAAHKENIAPFFAALACDLILSHQQNADHVSDRFKDLYLQNKIPHEKYIFMFLNSLSKERKIKLLSVQGTSADVCKAVNADDIQINLVAEIARSRYLEKMLADIRTAKIEPSAPNTPLYPNIAPIEQLTASSSADPQ